MSRLRPEKSTSAATVSDVEANNSAARSKFDTQAQKKADLAGPGIGDYAELEKILPQGYNSCLTRANRHKRRSFTSAATLKIISARMGIDDGPGPVDRRRRKRRQRHTRP